MFWILVFFQTSIWNFKHKLLLVPFLFQKRVHKLSDCLIHFVKGLIQIFIPNFWIQLNNNNNKCMNSLLIKTHKQFYYHYSVSLMGRYFWDLNALHLVLFRISHVFLFSSLSSSLEFSWLNKEVDKYENRYTSQRVLKI